MTRPCTEGFHIRKRATCDVKAFNDVAYPIDNKAR